MVRLQISLVLFILNGRAKTKLAILAFLCCGEFVKTSILSSLPAKMRQSHLFTVNESILVSVFC